MESYRGKTWAASMKAHTFDGKSSWGFYCKLFEAVTRSNGWSDREKAVVLAVSLKVDANDVIHLIPIENM